MDSIATSPTHRCIRRFYVGDKDGTNYLEMEFYPCVRYSNLPDEYLRMYEDESENGHRLRYYPRQRTLPCSLAFSKIREFLNHYGLNVVLFNEETDSYSEKVVLQICEELGLEHINIRWTPEKYTKIPTCNLKKGDEELTPLGADLPWYC